MKWSSQGKDEDLARVGLVELTQEQYLVLLKQQTMQVKRKRMKIVAFSAIHGGDPKVTIWMPTYLIG